MKCGSRKPGTIRFVRNVKSIWEEHNDLPRYREWMLLVCKTCLHLLFNYNRNFAGVHGFERGRTLLARSR
jgi:hypothetical protein